MRHEMNVLSWPERAVAISVFSLMLIVAVSACVYIPVESQESTYVRARHLPRESAVEVAGAVEHPGVYRVARGERTGRVIDQARPVRKDHINVQQRNKPVKRKQRIIVKSS